MELINEFRVDSEIETVWATLTDLEGIAPCMPGAQLTEIDGDDFNGTVKVKVGPITVQYQGTARFVEKNDDDHLAIIDASGRDTRGAGNANATITAKMSAEGDATVVVVTTDLKVTGKVAQFGRGVMSDVSEKLLGQFVECLEVKLADPDAGGKIADGTDDTADAPSRQIDMPEAKPVDLLDTAGFPLLKRVAPFLVGLLLLRWLRRRR